MGWGGETLLQWGEARGARVVLMVPEGKNNPRRGHLGLVGVPHSQGEWLGLWWVVEPRSSWVALVGVPMSLCMGTVGGGQSTPSL